MQSFKRNQLPPPPPPIHLFPLLPTEPIGPLADSKNRPSIPRALCLSVCLSVSLRRHSTVSRVVSGRILPPSFLPSFLVSFPACSASSFIFYCPITAAITHAADTSPQQNRLTVHKICFSYNKHNPLTLSLFIYLSIYLFLFLSSILSAEPI